MTNLITLTLAMIKQKLKYIVLLLVSLPLMHAFGQDVAEVENTPYPDYQEDVFMDMELSQNVVTPKVPADLKGYISSYQKKIADELTNHYTVDLTRDDEVFIVCIPSNDIFLPNDTLLSSYAPQVLNPVLDLMKGDPYMYKIVVAIHTDDTGSDKYLQNLSTARTNSIYDWLLDAMDSEIISWDLVVIPYPMASTDPLVDNDTMENRQQNRRVEFYFIPGPKMIDMAKNKQLH